MPTIYFRRQQLPLFLPADWYDKFNHVLWLLLALVMPWGQVQSTRFTSIFSILLIVVGILGTPFVTSIRRLKAGKWWIGPWVMIYLIQILWLLKSNNLPEGIHYVGTRLGLLWIPLVLLLKPQKLPQWRRISWIFGLSTLAVFGWMNREGLVWLQDCPICYIEILSALERPYLAPYLLGAGAMLISSYWPWGREADPRSDVNTKTETQLGIALAALLMTLSLVVYAKMSTISLVFALGVASLVIFLRTKNRTKWALGLAGGFGLIWLLLMIVTPTLLAGTDLVDHSGVVSSAKTATQPFWIIESFRTRLQIWQVVGQSLAENTNWLVGVGTGGVQNALHRHYCLVGIGYCHLQYNPHNQFLEFWLQMGILGLLLMFCWLGTLAYQAIKHQVYPLLIWLLYLTLCLSTECMINREAGVLLIGLVTAGLWGINQVRHQQNGLQDPNA